LSENPVTPEPFHRSRIFEWTALAVICFAALVVRILAFQKRGVVDYDETYYYILGRNLVTGAGYTLNGLPHSAFPPLYPILVGLASLIRPSILATSMVVSSLAGALLPVPVYFLGKDVHGRRAGLIAAAAAAVWPALFFFAAVNVPYAQRLYFGSEQLYVTLLAATMLFVWRSARADGYADAIFAGLFGALSSLVRSEGPVVFAFLLAWLVACRLASRTLASHTPVSPARIARVAVVAAAFVVAFSPFLVYVHHVTGRWTLGAKLANNARIRGALWNWVELNDSKSFFPLHYALNREGNRMEDPYWGVSAWHRAHMTPGESLSGALSLVASPDWRWLPVLGRAFYSGRGALVPWFAWIFVLAGVILPPWDSRRLLWWTFWAANFLPMALLAVSLYALPRHELPLLVLFAVALGKGLAEVSLLFARGTSALFKAPAGAAGAVGLVPVAAVLVALYVAGYSLNMFGNHRPGIDKGLASQALDRKVSKWLTEHLPAGSTVMCHEPWVAVWAKMDWRVTPSASPARVIAYGLDNGFDYAVLKKWQVKTYPDEMPLVTRRLDAELDLGDPVYVLNLKQPPAKEPADEPRR